MAPPCGRRRGRGFGSTLIERAFSIETGGRAAIDYRPEGVMCDITLPPASVTVRRAQSAAPAPDAADSAEHAAQPAIAARILVVEDSALILMLLEEIVEDAGWQIVGPASRVPEGLALAREQQIDAAILDMNLAGTMSWDIAVALQSRGIPFMFSTGYDAPTVMPDALRGAPVINKPFQVEDVRRRLLQLVVQARKQAVLL